MSRFGTYLTTLRMKSGAASVSEYVSKRRLPISDTYYRALENGEKVPTVETVGSLADALRSDGADRNEIFQHYLQDVLPTDVFVTLVRRASTEAPTSSPKEAFDRLAQKENTIATYRTSLQKLQELETYAYRADDAMVKFLEEHMNWLPLVHFIYMKDGDATEEDLRCICECNRIPDRLDTILEQFSSHRIAHVSKTGTAGRGHYLVRRFNREFRLPPTEAGRSFRARWIRTEIRAGLDSDPVEKIQPDGTYTRALINCYSDRDSLPRIQERLLDLVAELNAVDVPAEDPTAVPFFVAIMISPRPDYFPRSLLVKTRQPTKRG